MSDIHLQPNPMCINTGVEPLVTELNEMIDVSHLDHLDPRRGGMERFIQLMFRKAYGAKVETFCPQLLAFSSAGHRQVRAVVGYRDGTVKPLFSEHYLDAPAEQLMSSRLGQAVHRDHLVEVGNLALAHPGQARWVIAATTVYLRAAGYRWVLFTAVTPLVNAFKRLGLRPIPLAVADPRRMDDNGQAWGRYYDGAPMVYAGDIEAGLSKLKTCPTLRHPELKALMDRARLMGAMNGGDDSQVPQTVSGVIG